MAKDQRICNKCGEPKKDAMTRLQYAFAFICNKCYRLWKRGKI